MAGNDHGNYQAAVAAAEKVTLMTKDFIERALHNQVDDIIKIGRVSRIDRNGWPYRCDVVVTEASYAYELTDVIILLPLQDGNDLGIGVWPSPRKPLENGQIVILLCTDGMLDGQKYIVGQIPDPDVFEVAIREVDVAVPDLAKGIEADDRKYLELIQLEPPEITVTVSHPPGGGPSAIAVETKPPKFGLLLSDVVEPLRVYYRHYATAAPPDG